MPPGCEDRIMVSPKKQSSLDAVSKTIIELLQEDGRRSYSDIGRVVGLSEAAVRQRVQRLTESGVMQIVAVTDPMQLGFHRQAMIGIRVSGDARVVAEAVAEIEAIDYVVITVGAFDVLAEVVCEDDEDLLALINDVIRPIDGVLSTETFIYAKLQKQLYNWGTR
jgi:Lrp/AsnC family transcriptional regulator for asnA, asnC and gidA